MGPTARRAALGRDSADKAGSRDNQRRKGNMNSQNKNKQALAGIKTLIATASVAATIVVGSMLPSNDPVSAAGTAGTAGSNDGFAQPPALSVPGNDSNQGFNNFPTAPSDQTSPDSQLPQVQTPRGPSRFPFTNTHSSR